MIDFIIVGAIGFLVSGFYGTAVAIVGYAALVFALIIIKELIT